MVTERLLSLIVMREGRPVGVVTPDAVKGIAPGMRPATPVRTIMAEADPLAPDDEAVTALQMLRDLAQLPVVEDGQVVGAVVHDKDAGTTRAIRSPMAGRTSSPS